MNNIFSNKFALNNIFPNSSKKIDLSLFKFTTWTPLVQDNKNYSKNEGSEQNIAWYGSRYLDFQGNQSIHNIALREPLDTSGDFSIVFRGNQNVNNRSYFDTTVSGYKLSFYGYYISSIPLRLFLNGQLTLQFQNSAEYKDISTTYVIKKTNGIMKGYVNGALNCEFDASSIAGTLISSIVLGNTSAYNAYLDGQMDFIAYFNLALSDVQIEQSHLNPNQFYDDCVNPNGELYASTLFATDFSGFIGNIRDDRNLVEYPITNYSPTQRTNFTAQQSGLNRVFRDVNGLGFYDGLRSVPKGDGSGYGVIVNEPRTSNVTLKVVPNTLSGNILSGGVVLDTAGLTAGVENDITLPSQTINADIKLFDGFDGEIITYEEELL